MKKEYSIRFNYKSVTNSNDARLCTYTDDNYKAIKFTLEDARAKAKELLATDTKENILAKGDTCLYRYYKAYAKIYKGRTCIEKIEL